MAQQWPCGNFTIVGQIESDVTGALKKAVTADSLMQQVSGVALLEWAETASDLAHLLTHGATGCLRPGGIGLNDRGGG